MIPELFECPSIYDWIQTCLSCRISSPFMTLPQFVAARSESSRKSTQESDQWSRLTPRTLMFEQLFSNIQPEWSATQIVEALSSAGADLMLLETLPEGILIPLQEAVVRNQAEPPTKWSKDLLSLIGREDVTMLLRPGQRPRQMQSTLLVSMMYSKVKRPRS